TVSSFDTAFASDFDQFGDVEVGDWLPYVPVHQGAVQVAAEHPRFGGAVAMSARSGMRDSASQGPLTRDDVPALVNLDASVAGHPSDHVELYATASNLLNTRAVVSWRPVGARPNAPLRVMVGVKLRGRVDDEGARRASP
ncbi:MAG: Fe(3+) dicitrate transport protein, partial [Myxococcota bacterium]